MPAVKKKTRAEKRADNQKAYERAKRETADDNPGVSRNLGGRPTTYSREVEDKVFSRVAAGMTLREAATEMGVHAATVLAWANASAEVYSRYTRAREFQAEIWADDLLNEADKSVDQVNVQSSKLRIETKKWLMGKNHIRRFGDKVTIAGDPDNPVRTINREMTQEECAAAWAEDAKRQDQKK